MQCIITISFFLSAMGASKQHYLSISSDSVDVYKVPSSHLSPELSILGLTLWVVFELHMYQSLVECDPQSQICVIEWTLSAHFSPCQVQKLTTSLHRLQLSSKDTRETLTSEVRCPLERHHMLSQSRYFLCRTSIFAVRCIIRQSKSKITKFFFYFLVK